MRREKSDKAAKSLFFFAKQNQKTIFLPRRNHGGSSRIQSCVSCAFSYPCWQTDQSIAESSSETARRAIEFDIKNSFAKKSSSSPPRCSSASALRAMAPQIDPELLDRATEVAIEAAKEAGKRRGEFLVAEEDDERQPAMPFGFPTAPYSSLTPRRRRASLRPLFLFSRLSLRRRASLRPLSPPQAPSSPLPSIRRPARPRAKSPACGTSSPPRTPRPRRPS